MAEYFISEILKTVPITVACAFIIYWMWLEKRIVEKVETKMAGTFTQALKEIKERIETTATTNKVDMENFRDEWKKDKENLYKNLQSKDMANQQNGSILREIDKVSNSIENLAKEIYKVNGNP